MPSSDEPVCLVAGLAYIARGWPVLAVKPREKAPLTRRGVKDATLDPAQLRGWFERWPNANIGIACGTPGPDALDIDDLVKGRDALATASRLGGPDVATARGRQFYFLGSTRGTLSLGYGELRSIGSYVVAPPSIHPDGKVYTFVVEPGDAALPRVPTEIVPLGTSGAGAGIMEAPELVPHGQRHGALKDYAVRLIRSGVLDSVTLEATLRAFYETRCVLDPPPGKDYFPKIVAWALKSHIAARERTFADHVANETPAKTSKKRGPTGLENPPRGDAPLKEHREFVSIAGGWGDRLDIETVIRSGQHVGDPLMIKLSNGQVIQFEKQDAVMSRGGWARTVVTYTNGIARPVALNEVEGLAVFRSLCILADAPPIVTEAETLADHVRAMVAACEVWDEHDLSTIEGRYDAIKRANARGSWTPRASEDKPPVLFVDRADQRHHLRAGEVHQWFMQAALKVASVNVPGRMLLIGAEVWRCSGRAPRVDGREQDKRRMMLYRLADDRGER